MEIISTYSLLPLLGAVFVIVLGFFVWFKKPREFLHILFLLFAFTISLWLYGTFRLFNATNAIDQIFWDRFIYIGVVFIPVFLFHFGIIYSDIKKQNWLLVVGYLIAFTFLPLSQTDYFVSGLYVYKWGVHTVAQTGHHFFLTYFFFYFVSFFVNLYGEYKKSTRIKKKQIKFMLIGFAILDVIGPLAYLPAYGIPIFPIIFLSAIPFALIVAYAIIKHNALEVKTITVEVFVTVLNLIALAEIFVANTYVEIIYRSVIFVSILVFSFFLVRSVKIEIKRREQVVELAESLEKANFRLKELDHQKTEFLSIASHQLRTPLSIIKGYIELIQDGAFGKITKKTKETLDKMNESNERLVKLIDEFLDITRIEQGRTKYSFDQYSMNDLIDSVVKELKDRAENKGLTIVWKRSKKTDKIYMDEEKIRHVIFNFVDNAIKYSPKGRINVSLNTQNKFIVVKVKDKGFGFNKKDEVNFFQKFYRGENVRGTNVNGTGLGIYVCKKFIEKHDGKVWGTSPGLGKGSEFGFKIPIKCSRKAAVVVIDEVTGKAVDNKEEISKKNKETKK